MCCCCLPAVAPVLRSVMPGVAAVLVSIDLEPVAQVAKTYLEGYVLAKWQDTSSVCPKESYANVCYTPKVRPQPLRVARQ